MRPSTTRPRERGMRLRFATCIFLITPQSDRSVSFCALQLCFGLLILVSLAIVMLNMGGPSTVRLVNIHPVAVVSPII